MKIVCHGLMLAVLGLALLALPQIASAAQHDGSACGSMRIGSTPFKQVSVSGGTCAEARSLIVAYRTKTLGCRAQSSYEVVLVRCGRYRGMLSKVVKFGNPWSAAGSHLLLAYRGVKVDAHPRLVKLALNGTSTAPKASGRASGPTVRFGTANGLLGMQSEHEMITRAALSCGKDSTPMTGVTVKGIVDPVQNCFEPRSIDNLAGYGSWTTTLPGSITLATYGAGYANSSGFGAVGAADNMAMRWMSGGPEEWHCDGADFLPDSDNGGKAYPQTITAARSRLAWCHDFSNMMLHSQLSGAYASGCGSLNPFTGYANPCTGLVPMAANLLDANGLAKSGMELTSACSFDGGQKVTPSYVKCSALEPFGYILHAVEDFYSHSNYSDASDTSTPYSITNPPGFGPSVAAVWPLPPNGPVNTLPDFWDLSANTLIDDISANLFGFSATVATVWAPWPITGCYPDASCTDRVTHTTMTKDLSGGIDYTLGANATIGAPGNPRGTVGDNALRAIRLAILEVRRQWTVAQQALMAKYGTQQGAMMICALTRDNPTVCNN